MATVFLNGKFLPQDEARLSAFDAGVQHGVGLFETMLGGAGDAGADSEPWVSRLDDHLDRLITSARDLGLSDQLRAGPLAEAVLHTVQKSGLPLARIRLTITGGDLNLLARAQQPRPANGSAPAHVQPSLMIVAQPATEYPPEMFDRGVSVVLADLRLNPLDPTAGHKTINYWARLRELQSAAAKQAGEALIFQITNHLAGGCVSNVFLVKSGELLTPIARGEEGHTAPAPDAPGSARPALPSPVLPGITRKRLLAWAAAEEIPVHRRMLGIEEVLGADEVFLTNSSWGVLPVVRVERQRIGTGSVGPLARRALDAWRDERPA